VTASADLKKARIRLSNLERLNKDLHEEIIHMKMVWQMREQNIEALKQVLKENPSDDSRD
jgi:hypothetical protein